MITFPASILRKTILTGLTILALGTGACSEALVNTRQTRANGIKQYNEGNFAESAATFRAAARANPTDYPSHYFLGASLARMGSYEQAIQQYKTTLDIMSIDIVGRDDSAFRLQVLDALAMAVVSSKDHDLQSITVKNAPPYENQFLLAKIHRGLGDPDAALDSYSQAALLAPTNFAVAKEYGLYLIQLNQKDNARTQLKRAYALNGNDTQVASALRNVGVVPGPSLKDEGHLAQPVIPVGPLPEVQLVIPAGSRESRTQAE